MVWGDRIEHLEDLKSKFRFGDQVRNSKATSVGAAASWREETDHTASVVIIFKEDEQHQGQFSVVI